MHLPGAIRAAEPLCQSNARKVYQRKSTIGNEVNYRTYLSLCRHGPKQRPEPSRSIFSAAQAKCRAAYTCLRAYPSIGANFRIHREATRLRAFRSCSILLTCTKHRQNLYTFGRPPTANYRISAPILRPESAPAAPQWLPFLGRFLHESDASLVMLFFAPFFALSCPFSLWSEAQKPVMHHFCRKCTAFAAPFARPAAAQKDRPSAIEMTNRRAPQKLYKTAESAPPRPPPQANMHI